MTITNPYYEFTPEFVPGTKVRSDAANAQFQSIQNAFDFLPAAADSITTGTSTFAPESGAGNAYVVTMPDTRASEQDGDEVVFFATHANTAAATLEVDGLGAKALVRADGSALAANDIQDGLLYVVRYDATNTRYQLVGPSASYLTNAQASATAAATSQSLAAEFASNAVDDDVTGFPGTFSALHWNTGAQAWAIEAEDSPVTASFGGDGSTTFSSFHWAQKAAADAAAAATFNPALYVTLAGAQTIVGVKQFDNGIVIANDQPIDWLTSAGANLEVLKVTPETTATVVDPLASEVEFFTDFEDVDNVDVVMTEQSSNATASVALDADIDFETGITKFGSRSAYFVPTITAPISFGDQAYFSPLANDWTMELWVRFAPGYLPSDSVLGGSGGGGHGLISKWLDAGTRREYAFLLNDDDEIQFEWSTTGSNAFLWRTDPLTWVADQWYHLAMVREGDQLRAYRDGIEVPAAVGVDTIGALDSIHNSDRAFLLGSRVTAGTNSWHAWGCYFDEPQFVIGTARYTENFTPQEVTLTDGRVNVTSPTTFIVGDPLVEMTIDAKTLAVNSSATFTGATFDFSGAVTTDSFIDTTTNLGQTANLPLVTFTVVNDWASRGIGTAEFLNASSTGAPTTNRFFLNQIGNRDTLGGYAYMAYGQSTQEEIYYGYSPDSSSFPTWIRIPTVASDVGITGDWTFSGQTAVTRTSVGGAAGSSFRIEASNPQLSIINDTAAVDTGAWNWFVGANSYDLRLMSDDFSTAVDALEITRSGTTPAAWTFTGTTFDFSSTVSIDGSLRALRTTGDGSVEVGNLLSPSTAFIDFHSSGNNNDYDARISVIGGTTQGTGGAAIVAAYFDVNASLRTATLSGRTADGPLNIYGGSGNTGANIEMYGSTHPSQANNAFHDAASHTFRNAGAASTLFTIEDGQTVMNQPLDTNASYIYTATVTDVQNFPNILLGHVRPFFSLFQPTGWSSLGAGNYVSGLEFRHGLSQDYRSQLQTYSSSGKPSILMRQRINGVWGPHYTAAFSNYAEEITSQWNFSAGLQVGASTRLLTTPTLRGTVNAGGSADDGGVGLYHGYSINNDIMFMHNGTAAGIYDELNDQWKVRFDTNATNVALYSAGIQRFTTQTASVNIHSDGNTDSEQRLLRYAYQNGTSRAVLGYDGTEEFIVRNQVHGGDVSIQGEDTGGIVRDLFAGSPDGNAALYENATNNELALTSQGRTLDNTTCAQVRHRNGSFYDVGMNQMPRVHTNASITIDPTDIGGFIYHNNSTNYTITLNNTTDIPDDSRFDIIKRGGSGTITIAQGTGVTITKFDGTTTITTGNIVIAADTVAWLTVHKYDATNFFVTGAGLP